MSLKDIKTVLKNGFSKGFSFWKRLPNARITEQELKTCKISKRIGDASVYGSVYLLDNSRKYVLKIMKRHSDFTQMFENEIQVGAMKNIEKVGVRIHCHYSTQHFHAYIMDHIVKNRPENIQFATLSTIQRSPVLRKTLENDVLYSKFAKTLVKFYKITQGYHGDLHLGNVMVLYDNNYDVKKIRIIDYGTFTKFKQPLHASTNMLHAINHAHKEWLKLPTTPQNTGFPGIKMKYTNYGAIRSNKNLLEFNIKHKKSPFAGILQQMILGWKKSKSNKKRINISIMKST